MVEDLAGAVVGYGLCDPGDRARGTKDHVFNATGVTSTDSPPQRWQSN